MSLNTCSFVGRLTDKPTGGQTNNDRPYARFSVAVQRNFKNQSGEYDADFINCIVYGNSADYLMQYGGQGDTVSVAGELRQDHWTDQQGNKHSALYVLVNQLQIVAHPQRNQVSRQHYEQQQQSYQQGYSSQPHSNAQPSYQAPKSYQQESQPKVDLSSLPFNNEQNNSQPAAPKQEPKQTTLGDVPF